MIKYFLGLIPALCLCLPASAQMYGVYYRYGPVYYPPGYYQIPAYNYSVYPYYQYQPYYPQYRFRYCGPRVQIGF
jgi:hypothetical protein